MRIRTRIAIAGNGLDLAAGAETEIADVGLVRRLDAAGHIIPLEPFPPETTVRAPAPERRAEPFGGKGDHDGDGRPGGAKKPARKARKRG